ncbi:hypothetical protein BCR33DRAFT_718952 [Rhizoclosmatium globosum]|uniref:Uncharacterized protein n=1 Tax=Rhizoclosmatium globosum TaxID=329046 RepID=A0A1Y2C2Q8_9FUNG|nr:hypothetical protein BCR33DRAFT_718952 [Rhizoclosmatium globosum]|eukprot:ORY41333.1 hypothetical protein BCR33DRAFT_718952 [Rhizoclosmatium globosum]
MADRRTSNARKPSITQVSGRNSKVSPTSKRQLSTSNRDQDESESELDVRETADEDEEKDEQESESSKSEEEEEVEETEEPTMKKPRMIAPAPRFSMAVGSRSSSVVQPGKSRFSVATEQDMSNIVAELKAKHDTRPRRANTELRALTPNKVDDPEAEAKAAAEALRAEKAKNRVKKLKEQDLQNRVPKYNRVPYKMASITPHVPGTPSAVNSPTTIPTVFDKNGDAAEKVSSPTVAADGKGTPISTKTGQKKTINVGYVPPLSSGIGFVPVSEQEAQNIPQSPTKHRHHHHNRPKSGGIPSWQQHSRRMGYDEYVRSVSRQSKEDERRRKEELEAYEKQIREERLAEAALAIQAEKQTDEPLPPPLNLNHDFKDEANDQISGLPQATIRNSVFGESMRSSVTEFRKASTTTRDATSPENQNLFNMASVLMSKTSGTPSTPGMNRMSERNQLLRLASPGDEIDLFTSITGQFRGGPLDPHFRFLRRNMKGVKLSGPAITVPNAFAPTYYVAEKKKEQRAKNDFLSKHSRRIQGAQAMKEHDWQVSRNKYYVGAGTAGMDVMSLGNPRDKDEEVNEAELRLMKVSNPEKYKRYMEKEKAKAFLLGKWEVLEQMRIHITAKTASLKHYHEYFQELSQENAELRERHKEVSYKTNTKISKTLEQNEAMALDIQRIDMERKRQFQILQGTYDEFEQNANQEIEKLEQKVDMTQKTVDRITLELDKLIEFKSLKESNPTAIANKIVEYKKQRDDHIKMRAKELEQIKIDWKADQAEIEQTWMAKVQTLIDAMGDSLKVHVDTSPSGNYYQNGRLRHEISVHKAQQAKAQAQIDEMLRIRAELVKAAEKTKDKRRNVLHLSEQMTCTPDMEFEVTPKNLLVKELGI